MFRFEINSENNRSDTFFYSLYGGSNHRYAPHLQKIQHRAERAHICTSTFITAVFYGNSLEKKVYEETENYIKYSYR
jgi:hypothetical protein